jgi:hypothetical protein
LMFWPVLMFQEIGGFVSGLTALRVWSRPNMGQSADAPDKGRRASAAAKPCFMISSRDGDRMRPRVPWSAPPPTTCIRWKTSPFRSWVSTTHRPARRRSEHARRVCSPIPLN